jgi:transcriptional regulator NrdR family protein
MYCTKCGGSQVYVIDSRDRDSNERRRRYECTECKNRFTTIERVVEKDILKSLGSDSLAETIRLAHLAKKFAKEVKGENK